MSCSVTLKTFGFLITLFSDRINHIFTFGMSSLGMSSLGMSSLIGMSSLDSFGFTDCLIKGESMVSNGNISVRYFSIIMN